MLAQIVMTVIGHDRPGIVERVSTAVRSAGGNWLESRMSRLGGQFAGILRVQVAEDRLEDLLAAMAGLEGDGLSVAVKQGGVQAPVACAVVATVAVVGADRPGIVSQIAAVFADRLANVEELSSECRSAPMSGEALFEATARVCLPANCSISQLRADLELLAADLMVDVSVESD